MTAAVSPHAAVARLEVLAARDAHVELLADFYRAVWDPRATGASVFAARQQAARVNVAEPGVVPPTFVALRGGRIIGFVTTLPICLWDGRATWPAYWVRGLMVLPEYRNGPIGLLLLREAARALPRTVAAAVTPAACRVFGAAGYADLGAIPNFVRPLAAGALLARAGDRLMAAAAVPPAAARAVRLLRASGLAPLAGAAVDTALDGFTQLRRAAVRGVRVSLVLPHHVEDELDALWSAARDTAGSGLARDARYLIQRYATAQRDNPYHWIAAQDRHGLVGLAVLRQPMAAQEARLAGLPLATLADLVAPAGRVDVRLALLGGVEQRARTLGAAAIVASASSQTMQRALRAQAYIRLGATIHLLVRDVSGTSHLAGDLAGWTVARGDGESDLTF